MSLSSHSLIFTIDSLFFCVRLYVWLVSSNFSTHHYIVTALLRRQSVTSFSAPAFHHLSTLCCLWLTWSSWQSIWIHQALVALFRSKPRILWRCYCVPSSISLMSLRLAAQCTGHSLSLILQFINKFKVGRILKTILWVFSHFPTPYVCTSDSTRHCLRTYFQVSACIVLRLARKPQWLPYTL